MNNNHQSQVLAALSKYWIETEYLFFISFMAHSVFIIGFFICIASLYDVDFSLLPKLSQIDARMIIIAFIFLIAAYILLTPLDYGIKWCYFRAVQGKYSPVSGAFFVYYEFDRWIKALKLKFITGIKKIMIYIPCVSVSLVGTYIGIELSESTKGVAASSFIKLGMIVLIYGAHIIYLVLSSKYEIVPFLFTLNPNENERKILYKGIGYMDDSMGGYASMIMSYTPFMWLCIFAFPAPILMPIFNMAKANAAYEIITLHGNVDDDILQAEVGEEKEVLGVRG